MSYMTISSQEKHNFSLCSCFHAHPTTLLLKILGGPMHGRSPHLKFWGDRPPPVPPRSPPLLAAPLQRAQSSLILRLKTSSFFLDYDSESDLVISYKSLHGITSVHIRDRRKTVFIPASARKQLIQNRRIQAVAIRCIMATNANREGLIAPDTHVMSSASLE